MIKNESLKESINDEQLFNKIKSYKFGTFTQKCIWPTLAIGKKYYIHKSDNNSLMAFYVKKIIIRHGTIYNLIKFANNEQMMIDATKYIFFNSIEDYNNYVKTDDCSYIANLNNIDIYQIMSRLFPNNIDTTTDYLSTTLESYIMVYYWNGQAVKRQLTINAIWIDEDKSLHCEYESGYYFSKEECIKANKPKIMDFDDNTEEDILQTFDVNITMKIEAKSKEDAELKIKNALDTITIE